MDDFLDDLHEKDRDRAERIKKSRKAREKRRLIKDKKSRQYNEGFGGNY